MVTKEMTKKKYGLNENQKQTLSEYKEKVDQKKVNFSYEVTNENGKDQLVTSVKKIEGVDPKTLQNLLAAELHKVTGVIDIHVSQQLIKETTASIASGDADLEQLKQLLNMVLEILKEMAPKDVFEGMLACRMIMLHFMGTKELEKAQHCKDLGTSTQYISRASKLLRLWNEAKDRWDKNRRPADQTMKIEHVHVNAGGQAIVGSVSQTKVHSEGDK